MGISEINPRVSAQRQAYGDLFLPHETAGDQQVRNVRAGDQQDQPTIAIAISTTSAVEKSLRSDE